MNIVLPLSLDRPPSEPTPTAQLVRLQACCIMLRLLPCFSSAGLAAGQTAAGQPRFSGGFLPLPILMKQVPEGRVDYKPGPRPLPA